MSPASLASSSAPPTLIGAAALYPLDCFAAFPLLPAATIDLVATDPPYFLHRMGDDWSHSTLSQSRARAGAIGGLPVGMKFDPAQGQRLQQFFAKVAAEAYRVLKPGAFFLAFAQGRLYHRLAVATEEAGFEIRDLLIWEHQGGQGKAFSQDHFVRQSARDPAQKAAVIALLQGRKTPQLRPKFEAIMLAQKPKAGTFVDNWLRYQTGLIDPSSPEGQQSTIFFAPKPRKTPGRDHLTIKPEALMQRLIEVFSIPGNTVLDPFLGSGTTAVAALHLGRRFIGFEGEATYFDQAVQRIRNLSL